MGHDKLSNGENSDREFELLIDVYIHALNVCVPPRARTGDLISQGNAFEALDVASRALLHYPCFTLKTTRRKVSFVLDSPDLYAMIREDNDEAGCLSDLTDRAHHVVNLVIEVIVLFPSRRFLTQILPVQGFCHPQKKQDNLRSVH